VPNPVRPDLPVDPHIRSSRSGNRFKEDITTQQPPEGHSVQTPPLSQKSIYRRRVLWRVLVGVAFGIALLFLVATPAFAAGASAPTLNSVIDNLRNWIVGFLAALATLFLTIGGVRYLTAGGDPGQVEKAKTALKSAAIGYALAILAPLLVSILASVVGG
jgi:hypothetical protein